MGRDAATILAMRVAGTVLWLAFTVVLARMLAPSEFAEAIYVINFSLFAVLLTTLGRDTVLIRFGSNAWDAGDTDSLRLLLAEGRVVVLKGGIVVTAGLLIASLYGLDTPVTQSPSFAALTGLIVIAAAQMTLNRDCLRAVGRVTQSQIGFNIIRAVVPLIGVSVAYCFGQTLTAPLALLLFLSALGLSLGIEHIFLRRVPWGVSGAGLGLDRTLADRAGWATWPGDVANAFVMRSAGLVGALVLPAEQAALLLVAERIAGLAQFPISAAAQAAGPRIAASSNATRAELQAMMARAVPLMVVGAVVGAFGSAMLAWPALVLMGAEYRDAIWATLVLLLACLSWAVFGFGQSTLVLLGHGRIYSLIASCAAALALVTIYLGAARYGPAGAAAAWCAVIWAAGFAYSLALRLKTGLRVGIFSVGWDSYSVRRLFGRGRG